MAIAEIHMKKRLMSGVIFVASVFLLSACSTFSLPFTGSKTEKATAAEADGPSQLAENSDGMRAQCAAMHEKMKAKMTTGEMMMEGDMMSPEMKSKHAKCMEAMPEMHQEMHEKCMAMDHDGTGDHKMNKEDMQKMHDHCMMMQDEAGDDSSVEEQ